MKYSQQQLKSPVLLWSESEFQSHVVTLAKQMGFTQVYHTADSRRSEAGFPDLVLVNARSRRTLFVELKRQDGRVSSAQEQWIDALLAAGQSAMVWRPSDWVAGLVLNTLAGKEIRRAGTR